MTVVTWIIAGAAAAVLAAFTIASIAVVLRGRPCTCTHSRKVHGLYRDAEECAVCGCRKFTAARTAARRCR